MRGALDYLGLVSRKFGASRAGWALACLALNRVFPFSVWGCFVRSAAVPALEGRPAGAFQVEELTPEQLQGLARQPEYDLTPEFLEAWSRRPGWCFGIRSGPRWLGYAFFARGSTGIDRHWSFSFPADHGYVFKTFTLPEWRGHGVNRVCLASSFGELARRPEAPPRWVCLIDSINYASIRSFEQLGFRRAGWLLFRGAMPDYRSAWLSAAARQLGFAVTASPAVAALQG